MAEAENELTPVEPAGDRAPKREEGGGLFDFPNPSGDTWTQAEEKPKDKAPREPRKPGRPKGSTNQRAKTKRAVSRFYVGLGAVTMKFDEYDGTVILSQAENLTDETMKVADEYPWVMDVLEQWTTVSVVGGFVGVLSAVTIPILANHGFIPEIVVDFMDAPPLPERDEFHDEESGV